MRPRLLKGVRFTADGATTSSLVLRLASGTRREINSYHRWGAPADTLHKPVAGRQHAKAHAAHADAHGVCVVGAEEREFGHSSI